MNVAIVLNWCSYEKTINAVKSVLDNCPTIDRIVVVDNFSPDGSGSKLEQYYGQSCCEDVVQVLKNHCNSGYAGGNNAGIRYAINQYPDLEFVWILNSDTRVQKGAFESLHSAARLNPRKFYGSVIASSSTGRLECYGGGKLIPLLGKAKLVGKGKRFCEIASLPPPDYLMGCSLLVSRTLLEEVGLMDESYFMYSEEVDWQWRAKRLGYGIEVVNSSVVEHEGAGSSGGKGTFYFFYRNRAAVLFNKRFYGSLFAFVSAILLSAITIVQCLSSPPNAYNGVKGAWAGIFGCLRYE